MKKQRRTKTRLFKNTVETKATNRHTHTKQNKKRNKIKTSKNTKNKTNKKRMIIPLGLRLGSNLHC